MSTLRRVGAAAVAGGVAVVAVVALAPPASADPVVDLGGTPVPGGPGSTERSDPTVLTAGLWSAALSPSGDAGETRHYAYDRTMGGSTVWVSVVSAGEPDADSGDGPAVEVLAADGTPCDSESGSPSYDVGFAVVGVGIGVGLDDPTADPGACTTSQRLQISVRHYSSSAEDDLPFALKIVEEAPLGADAASDLPTQDGTPSRAPSAEAGDGDVPAGATSFDDAPLLADGASGTVSVTEGEQRLWRVHLDWGQELAVEAEVPRMDDATRTALDDPVFGPTVRVGLVTPMRRTLEGLGDDQDGEYLDAATLRTGLAPVTYLGRADGSAPGLPGDYWVTIAVSTSDGEADPVDVPVELTVSTPTSDRAGATDPPGYAGVVTSPSSGEGPAGYDASTPFLVGDDTFAADPSGNPAPNLSDSGGADDTRRWWGAGVAVVSLLCCAAGVWRFRSA